MDLDLNPPSDALNRFGKFLLRERLGTGGMAEVFLAEMVGPEGFGKLVALKRILSQLSDDEEFIEYFISEARLGGSLNHPNIVQTLELGCHDRQYFLAMEYVEGVTLGRLLRHARRRQEALPLAVVLDIARQMCDGLAYAHSAKDPRGNPLNMIHRDLKPENVLLSLFGSVKLSDFGIARAESNIRKTVTLGAIKGTLGYMSPEQAAGDPLDHRSDLYSMGSVLFELLTLEPLYPKLGPAVTLELVRRGEVEERLGLLEAHPAPLLACLRRLLALDPGARQPSAAKVKLELLPVAASLPFSSVDLGVLVQSVLDEGPTLRRGTWTEPFATGQASIILVEDSSGSGGPSMAVSSEATLAERAFEDAYPSDRSSSGTVSLGSGSLVARPLGAASLGAASLDASSLDAVSQTPASLGSSSLASAFLAPPQPLAGALVSAAPVGEVPEASALRSASQGSPDSGAGSQQRYAPEAVSSRNEHLHSIGPAPTMPAILPVAHRIEEPEEVMPTVTGSGVRNRPVPAQPLEPDLRSCPAVDVDVRGERSGSHPLPKPDVPATALQSGVPQGELQSRVAVLPWVRPSRDVGSTGRWAGVTLLGLGIAGVLVWNIRPSERFPTDRVQLDPQHAELEPIEAKMGPFDAKAGRVGANAGAMDPAAGPIDAKAGRIDAAARKGDDTGVSVSGGEAAGSVRSGSADVPPRGDRSISDHPGEPPGDMKHGGQTAGVVGASREEDPKSGEVVRAAKDDRPAAEVTIGSAYKTGLVSGSATPQPTKPVTARATGPSERSGSASRPKAVAPTDAAVPRAPSGGTVCSRLLGAADGNPGFLTVNTVPWAYVKVEGCQLPVETPLSRFALPPGRYTLTFITAKYATRTIPEVLITAGKETRMGGINFREDAGGKEGP